MDYLNTYTLFQKYHQYPVNVFLHLFTTVIGVWGAIGLLMNFHLDILIVLYTVVLLNGTPQLVGFSSSVTLLFMVFYPLESSHCIALIGVGFVLQELSHWLTGESTFLSTYIMDKPSRIIPHTLWLLPCVMNAVIDNYWFLPYIVPRKNLVRSTVNDTTVLKTIRTIVKHETLKIQREETTHLWSNHNPEISALMEKMVNDDGIKRGFQTLFTTDRWDVKPARGMNEVYTTAIGKQNKTTSDTVFYTPHCDGPFWWTPGASLFRVMVAVTPNVQVKTRFNHSNPDGFVLTTNDVLGFDYNRELHWIDHTEKFNKWRRTVLKLHYMVYPKGWHRYATVVEFLNTRYNTWARARFRETLVPESVWERMVAFSILTTTKLNTAIVQYVGWWNMVYVAVTWCLGPTLFLIATSFRHYILYMATYQWREEVNFGVFVRDAKLFKTLAYLHIGCRLPALSWWVIPVVIGLFITMMATWRLGTVRTYFGAELGIVQPKHITRFPYGWIPHPMIIGQLVSLAFLPTLTHDQWLVPVHCILYFAHMIQEINGRICLS
jgi:hypothetical protein